MASTLRSLLPFLVAIPWSLAGCSHCDNTILESQRDPSGRLEARLLGRTCGSVSGFVVEVWLEGSEAGEEIFQAMAPRGADAGRDLETRAVQVEWVAASRLRVTYASALQTTRLVVRQGRVEVEFEPSDELNAFIFHDHEECR